jgi:hypothetical protein
METASYEAVKLGYGYDKQMQIIPAAMETASYEAVKH